MSGYVFAPGRPVTRTGFTSGERFPRLSDFRATADGGVPAAPVLDRRGLRGRKLGSIQVDEQSSLARIAGRVAQRVRSYLRSLPPRAGRLASLGLVGGLSGYYPGLVRSPLFNLYGGAA